MDIVFQVHERTEEIDFLLLVTRKLLYTNSQSVKVGSNSVSAIFSCKKMFVFFYLWRSCFKEFAANYYVTTFY